MKLTYWGHAAAIVETQSHKIVFDPFLTGNPLATVKADEVECDYIILTHGHNDHFGDTIEIAKANDATVISNFEIASFCEKKGCKAHPMHLGGAWNFDFGRVKLTIAHHGSSYQDGDEMIYMGNPAGVLLTSGEKTLYHAGDTALFYDMKLIGEMNEIDLALLPIGDNFTMGIDDAVKAVEFLKPKVTVPIHYDTFGFIEVDAEEFVQKVSASGGQAKILKPGEKYNLAA